MGREKQAKEKKPEALQARVENKIVFVPSKRPYVVLELTPEEAQTIFALGNHASAAASAVRPMGASSYDRELRKEAERHLGNLFYRLQPVVGELFKEDTLGFSIR